MLEFTTEKGKTGLKMDGDRLSLIAETGVTVRLIAENLTEHMDAAEKKEMIELLRSALNYMFNEMIKEEEG